MFQIINCLIVLQIYKNKMHQMCFCIQLEQMKINATETR